MEIIPMLLKEMDEERETTLKMFAAVPNDKYDWQPHPKSMTIRALVTHIAELPEWVSMVLNTTELDFAQNAYEPQQVNDNSELLAYYDRSFSNGHNSLEQATEADLLPQWTLRNGEDIYSVSTKAEMIRTTFCQIVHHRAQLGVYLRLLNIPIPGSYGPSADEMQLYNLPAGV